MSRTCQASRRAYTDLDMINDIKIYITSIHSSKTNIITQLDTDKQTKLAKDIFRYLGLTNNDFIFHIECNDELKQRINIYLNSYNFDNLSRGGDKKKSKKYRKKSRKSKKYHKKSKKNRKKSKKYRKKKSRNKRR